MSPPELRGKSEVMPNEAQLAPETVRAALERVLGSPRFRTAKTLSRLFRHIVERTLDGYGASLKEYSLGVDVFGRGTDFDPRVDSIVRVETSRLRSRLTEYYRNEGQGDPVRIEIRKGCYIPTFQQAATPEADSARANGTNSAWRRAWIPATIAAAVVVLAATFVHLRPSRADIPALPSIAVLPFVNHSSEKGAAYFSDAVTEEITNALAQVPGLRVAAQSSARYFQNRGADLHEIGKELRVAAVLEGSVQKISDRLHITAALVDTRDSYYRWSQTYDIPAMDLFTISAGIASEAAACLGLKDFDHANFLKPHTKNAEAYKLVLKARYAGADRIGYYQKAIQYDPDYTEAYIGLAGEWSRLAIQGELAPRSVMEKARDAVQKALALDNAVSEAHFNAAVIKWAYDWDWSGAEQEFLRAIQLNPNATTVRIQYARYLALMVRPKEALEQLEQIRVLDPVSAALRGIEAAVFYFLRDYDRTIEHTRAVLEAQPDTWLLHFWMGRAYESQGKLQEATAELENWYKIPGNMQGRGFGMLASVYARGGRKTDALRLLRDALQRSKQTYVSPASIALVYIGLGDFKRAMDWLETGYQERDHSLVSIKADPAYDPLRGHPRFASLLRRMKLE